MTLTSEIRSWLEKDKTLLGFDFDGTLVPLQPNPESVRLSAEMAQTLTRLSQRYDCALISGRELEDLRRHAPIPDIHYIGTHGSQILRKSGELWQWSSEQWFAWRATESGRLRALVDSNGGWIEDKRLGLTVHFRNAKHEAWWVDEGEKALGEIVGDAAEVMGGVKCWNIKPRGAPNKGTSALRLCRDASYERIVFWGDEVTDEYVFDLKEIPVLGVKIGPEETKARFRLDSQKEVLEVLRALA